MRLGIVLIGRNEGARLVRCLDSVAGQAAQVIYVDSGSTDDSMAAAEARGAQVVTLDTSVPFTAARARAAGYAALDGVDVVQFVDGDCGVDDGWLEAGLAALGADDRLGMVTGWRSEIHPDASVYNALCHYEWRRPAGEIETCGGDMMVRVAAYEEAGGWRADVIAAEDDEFCQRLRKAGWRLERLPVEMTRHDAAMTRFGQWWRRAVRSGHGFAQVGDIHPEFFRRERKRVWVYGLVLPVIAVIGLAWSGWLVLLALAGYAYNYARTFQGLRRDLPTRQAAHHALFITLSKIPNMIGMATYLQRKRQGAAMEIIEYK
ncbi:glycosyltransferase [Pseudaestuariivita atlantica]|uniref:Glycosyl transferase n=1 Tax=Pseudaestuariivita atlantica TaxID=1317121 RepID=A0A0L1JPA0_9RHOB|nr:glycosyltransferase [Pseudaestuariivita atlantica]KNG93537.1 glycosyl transferase [Pseudaestuariivita atlantica]